MPNYGDCEYWDKRYSDDCCPFDWLFDYKELHSNIEYLIPEKDSKILVVGCGNAPFSPDLYTIGKYTNVTNMDSSTVVIEQQAELYPFQQWHIMDVLDMGYRNDSFPFVIDKSLIDTLVCCPESERKVRGMIDEIYRVLAPGGRYITLSLHSVEEVIRRFEYKPTLTGDEITLSPYGWKISAFRVKSNRWNLHKNRRRAVAHTMIICDKPLADGTSFSSPTYPLDMPNVLTDEEYFRLKKRYNEINLTAALTNFSSDFLEYIFFQSVKAYQEGNLMYIDRDELINNYHEGYVREEKALSRQIYFQVLAEEEGDTAKVSAILSKKQEQTQSVTEMSGEDAEEDDEDADAMLQLPDEQHSVQSRSTPTTTTPTTTKAVYSPPPSSYMSHASTISSTDTLEYDEYSTATTGSLTPHNNQHSFAQETSAAAS